jgi:Na+/H+-dicarboxylate symporter
MRLHHWIFALMAVGIVIGLVFGGGVGQYDRNDDGVVTRSEFAGDAAAFDAADEDGDGVVHVEGRATLLLWLDFIGQTLFIGLLKMIIAPLILMSIVAGITSIPSPADAGRIGGRTLLYYMATTTIAVGIGLLFVLTIQPGKQGKAEQVRRDRAVVLTQRGLAYQAETGQPATMQNPDYRNWLLAQEGQAQEESKFGGRFRRVTKKRERSTFDLFVDDIVKPLISNPFRSLAEGNSLGIIFFALLIGLALVVVGEPGRPMVAFFQAGNAAIMRITHWLMLISPVAIMCLIAAIVMRHGPSVFETLGWYCGTVIAAIGAHVCVLLAICAFVGRLSPITFLRGMRDAWAVAFTTRSSAATLPVTIRCVTEKLGVSKRVANFTLPVGATVNMDGTALYEGIAIIFLIQLYGDMADVGITLTAGVTIVIFITAVLASVGAAAVPDAGLVTMVLVATAVHLPVYYLPFIFAVDAFLDMFRTSTNVMGDAVGAIVVGRLEGDGSPLPAD